MSQAGHAAVPWNAAQAPARILVMRLQALGDVVATLPAVRGLRALLLAAEIDFLTRRETADLPLNLELFDRVHVVEGGRNASLQRLHALWLAPRIARRRYEVVVDLQNNARQPGDPPARPRRGLERIRPLCTACARRARKARARTRARLPDNARSPARAESAAGGVTLLPAAFRQRELVVLNPAGAWPTRNWPLDNYVRFARHWRERHANAGFVVLGDARIAEQARALAAALGGDLVDLVARTTVTQAFEILSVCRLVLSEDSGLMHLAWIGGTPTLALFGSTRSDWSRPLGPHSVLLDSSDLPCGQCMSPSCRYGDVRCLTRYTPEEVAARAEALLASCPEGAVNARPLPPACGIPRHSVPP